MRIKVKTKIGNVVYEFDVEEQQELETLHKAIVLSSPRKKCNICDAIGYESKYLTTNKSTNEKGTFTYISCKCAKCGARSSLGQYKAGGYFWKDYEVFTPKDGQDVKQPTTDEGTDIDDIPPPEAE